ncbi:hypothetical protein KIN20_021831 [Parelaphostrongylus tenuis]|uniref:Uncharacterized protein n=1 Tax=Parelaphostrongylus tenuis TaxID=148309 RepID=A0AAD5N7F1_PARTN|nr:hypothetical protein KIN20_021831 [Parelaphostrongylus tenuis]
MTLESKWYRRGSRTLDRKWSEWRGRHPAATNLNSQFDHGASSERSFDFIRTTSPRTVLNFALLSVARHKLGADQNNTTTEPSPQP